MTHKDRKREAVKQALRILGGSCGGNFAARVEQLEGLMRLAIWLGLAENRGLREVWKAALNLKHEEFINGKL